MSGNQHGVFGFTDAELDDMLDEALANQKIRRRLARPFKLVTSFDIALLGSSSIGGWNVYSDRHLRHGNWPYGFLPIGNRRLNVKRGLIRHERLEQACEDELGWPYKIAHPVAQHWEERDYIRLGFEPKEVEKAFEPYIKHDDTEKIIRSPTDFDMRPLMAPPRSDKVIARVNETAQKEKQSHAMVGYVGRSEKAAQRCDKCVHFIASVYGGPACVGVKSPIDAAGWCRRFKRGSLEKQT